MSTTSATEPSARIVAPEIPTSRPVNVPSDFRTISCSPMNLSTARPSSQSR
jgi:hypothetical protein